MGGYYRLIQFAKYFQSTAVRAYQKQSLKQKITSFMKNTVKMMKPHERTKQWRHAYIENPETTARMLSYLNEKLSYRPYNHISLDQVKVHYVLFAPRTMPPIGREAIKIMNSPELLEKFKTYT